SSAGELDSDRIAVVFISDLTGRGQGAAIGRERRGPLLQSVAPRSQLGPSSSVDVGEPDRCALVGHLAAAVTIAAKPAALDRERDAVAVRSEHRVETSLGAGDDSRFAAFGGN